MATTEHEPTAVPAGYVEPTTREEARRRIDEVRDRLVVIQNQLGDPNRLDEHGRRLTEAAWQDWHRRAKWALRWALAEQRLLKAWFHANPPAKRPKPAPPVGPTEELIDAAFDALKALAARVRELEAAKAGGRHEGEAA